MLLYSLRWRVLAVPFAAHAKVFPDPSHDTKARDLDIRKVDASLRGGSVRIDNHRRGSPEGRLDLFGVRSLWEKVLAIRGQTRGRSYHDLPLFVGHQQEDEPVGRTRRNRRSHGAVECPAFKLGCTKTNLRLYVTAEGTNGRKGLDELPKQKSAPPELRPTLKAGAASAAGQSFVVEVTSATRRPPGWGSTWSPRECSSARVAGRLLPLAAAARDAAALHPGDVLGGRVMQANASREAHGAASWSSRRGAERAMPWLGKGSGRSFAPALTAGEAHVA